jgi:hypothetical protein
MDSVIVVTKTIAAVAVVGALLETFVPGSITEKLQGDLAAITICLLGILFSYYLLILLLQPRIREGFEEAQTLSRWTTLVTENKVSEVCSLYTEMYERILVVEKGAPPGETKTDAQAREAVDKRFAEKMTVSSVSCSLFEDVQSKAQKLDTLFVAIQKVPNDFLVQVYQTANACRALLLDNYNQVIEAENRKIEGFQDLCSGPSEEERRAFLARKPLSDDAQKCLLAEEIPPEKKEQAVLSKLTEIEKTWNAYKLTGKDPINKVLEDCKFYKTELDKKKQEAEALSNKYSW